jgi:dTDP-4-amino-4,6-dideoxygalactose transaminase
VHGYQAYVCLYAPEEPSLRNVAALHERRNRLMARLEAQGIATRQGTHAPIALGYYARKYGLHREAFPNAWLADQLTIALPLYPQLSEAEQDSVVAALLSGPDA